MSIGDIVSVHFLKIAIRIMVIVLLLAGAANAATSISSCITISSPGEYILNMNILNSNFSSCINITSSNVILEGNGYIIDGVMGAVNIYGINVFNSTSLKNITIRNLTVSDWGNSIYFQNIQNGNI